MTQRLVSHTTATESLLFQPLCWKRWPLCHGVGGCWAQAQRGLQDHTRRGSSRPTQRQCLSRKTRCMGWPEANVSPTPMHLSLALIKGYKEMIENDKKITFGEIFIFFVFSFISCLKPLLQTRQPIHRPEDKIDGCCGCPGL
jgi:hypothetical protein